MKHKNYKNTITLIATDITLIYKEQLTFSFCDVFQLSIPPDCRRIKIKMKVFESETLLVFQYAFA